MSGEATLRVVLAGAEAGVDPGRLARRVGGAGRLLACTARELHALGATQALVAGLARARCADVAGWRRSLEACGVRCLALEEAAYPERLRQLDDPPLALFTLGERLEAVAWPQPVLAVVGSRRAADHSLRLARRLASFAAGRGALVVSGLALGIDAAAHQGALEAGGATLSVLGCGIDVVYPRRHARLAAQVRAHGLVVSEYPPATAAAPWRFPARNRLIAAFADAVLVVEARARSGALITADHALELGREVLAVPGSPAASAAAGVNALLKAGAGLVEDEDDLAGWLGLDPPAPVRPAALNASAARILASLGDQPAFAEELVARLSLAAADVARGLAELELEGLLCRDGGGRWLPQARAAEAVSRRA